MLALSEDTETLARRLAEAQNTSIEVAVSEALKAKALNTGLIPPASPRRRMTREDMLEMAAEIAAMPLLDPRSTEEIIDEINDI